MKTFSNRMSNLFGFALLTIFSLSEGHVFMKDGFLGVGLDLGKLGIVNTCPNTTNVTCPCGHEGQSVSLTISICSYVHRLRVKCKPCDDRSEEDLCPKYERCRQCHPKGDRCSACPGDKFGDWCQNDCPCINGGTCDINGKCNCPEFYEGNNCEKKKGCTAPGPIAPPLQVVITPPQSPVTAVYSCPQNFQLKGTAVSTCLPNDKWSAEPPLCLPTCPLLSAPANSRLTFSANDLVEGVTATVLCNAYHRLVGEKTLTCVAGGRWNGELPVCEKLAFCPDPGEIKNAERTVPPESVKLGSNFLQDSRIEYKCHAGYEQLGADSVKCQFYGSWSDDLPSCIKVSTVIPDCFTKGSDVVSSEGVSVRIICPPECVDEDFRVWGTSIYRQDSSVCQAAIHSAKITNSGGQVAVINNGPYSHFTGSTSNYVESESYKGRDESFRFDKLPPLKRDRNPADCGKGLVMLDHTCAYLSNNARNFEESQAVCKNLGLQLQLPASAEDRNRLTALLASKNIKAIWKEVEPEHSIPETSETPYSSHETPLLNSSTLPQQQQCSSLIYENTGLREERKSCKETMNFVCLKESEGNALAICTDPGLIENGKAEPIGQIEGVYYVGSAIEFTCQSMHFIKGESSIYCLANGTWSSPKPTCTKVNACEDAPVPFAGYITYLPPLKSQTAQRIAITNTRLSRTGGVGGIRRARLPTGLSPALPENMPVVTTTSEPETVSLPPGYHRIGSRATYTCESNYYKLIGSITRRCQGEGEWSGRPPTCIPVCGRSDSPRAPFIVNGNATDIGQWPWQAGIARYLPDYNQWFLLCGASLLNERWLITAAHCVTYAGTTLTIEADKFQIYVGKYYRQDNKDDSYVQVRKIQEIHIHPDYDPGLFDADIALLQLNDPVQINSRVKPICLPTEETSKRNLVEGTRGVVTGWGMNENETYSDRLMQAVLPVVSHEKCERGYEESDLPLTVTQNMFCAGYEQGRADACSGDSGGPIVFTDETSVERKWVLEGIVSWGSPQGCGNPKQYGGFTTVSKFLDWINFFI